MKIILSLAMAFFSIFLGSCTKDSTTSSPSATGKCKLVTESTNLVGNNASYQYRYSSDGNLSSIIRYNGGVPDSTAVFYDRVVTYSAGRSSGTKNIYAIAYNANIFTGLPSTGSASITIDGVEQRNYWVYLFEYDTKNRLIKVRESTPSVVNDWEYDLAISYNDQDNVTAIAYSNSTGPTGTTVIPAAGYDDKPNPFAGIKNWAFLMHSGWNSSEVEPIFTALSKNNLLGYTIPGWKRTISYSYDDKGNPTTRTNTNTNVQGTYTFQENFGYQCN